MHISHTDLRQHKDGRNYVLVRRIITMPSLSAASRRSQRIQRNGCSSGSPGRRNVPSMRQTHVKAGRNQTVHRSGSKNTPSYRNLYLNDKVSVLGRTGYVSGFTNGGCYVKDTDGQYITLPGKTYKQVGIANVHRICHNNNWQYITKRAL